MKRNNFLSFNDEASKNTKDNAISNRSRRMNMGTLLPTDTSKIIKPLVP